MPAPPTPNPNDSANGRLNALWEKLAIGLLTIIIGYQQLQYQEMRADIKDTQSKVVILTTSKVDRSDLRDLEDRINNKIDGMKTDLIARLDLYFGRLNKK